MSDDTIQQIAEQARSWPAEDQQELVEHARNIRARRAGHYEVTADERTAIIEGLGQSSRGEFASDAELEALRSTYRK